MAIGDHVGYRYDILDYLGEGSYGNVYKGVDTKTRNDVAIKILRDDYFFLE